MKEPEGAWQDGAAPWWVVNTEVGPSDLQSWPEVRKGCTIFSSGCLRSRNQLNATASWWRIFNAMALNRFWQVSSSILEQLQ